MSIAQANDVFAEMYGLAKGDDAVGIRLTAVHIAESEKNQQFITALAENGYRIRNAESEEIDVTGRRRYFLNSGFGFIENDRVTGGWGTQIDITELREAQQALLQAEQERSQELERLNGELQKAIARLTESEERYRTLFEISSEGIYRFEFDQPISLTLPENEQIRLVLRHAYHAEGNQTLAAMYGFESPEAMVGLRMLDEMHIEGSEQNLAFISAWVKNKHQIRNYESEEHDRHGDPRYFLNNVTSIIRDGYVYGGWASQLDITELRLAQQALLRAEQERSQELERLNGELQQAIDRLTESEERYRTLFEISSEGIYRFEFDQLISIHLSIDQQIELIYRHWRVAEANTTYAAMYGKDNPEDLVGLRLTDFHVAESEQNRAFLKAYVESGYQSHSIESHETDLSGNPRYFLNNVMTMIKDGYAIGGWASQLDITELRLAQQALLEAEQQRNHIAREIHDTLAQSFGGILTQLQAADYFAEPNPDKAQYHRDRAKTLAQQGLAEARRSVWNLSQAGSEYRDLATLLPQILQQMTTSTPLQAHYTQLGTPFLLDPDLGMNLLRMVQESITNVLRHAEAERLDLTLMFYDHQQIQLSIRDNGRGFNQQHIPQGFGLIGLQQRADRLGATLQIKSELGQGTTIEILLSTTP
ncbi:PAS domain-containing protein [Nodosilinea sp. LEGE 07088]|uniref:PAS domain-containing sensor histidine kinase n=1 Tax=Nodosilinea sp. LEGE 07088 TaxID=2777968 RepID=UPI0018823818|nr:PAS domain-containing sensor histidine kinase [Nodosilinea sp. LEGE 07088]MBE9139790.1 PAS domain-containing protein [Nodosilinea sp. LEGE 07088]